LLIICIGPATEESRLSVKHGRPLLSAINTKYVDKKQNRTLKTNLSNYETAARYTKINSENKTD